MTLRCVEGVGGLCVASPPSVMTARAHPRPESKKKFTQWTLVSSEGDRDTKLKWSREATVVEVFQLGQRLVGTEAVALGC